MASVRIRMYRQGLGDCFLLSFPRGRARSYVLIDCGVLKGTVEGQERMRAVAADIEKTTKGKLDLLIVTHEHWDHVSGFVQAREHFARMKIKDVWVAWTEKPDHELAKELRERRKRTQRAVRRAAMRLRGATDLGERRNSKRIEGLLNFFGGLGARGDSTTAAAMAWAQTAGKVEYLFPGQVWAMPGGKARAYVLGPPESKKLLRKSDPSRTNPEVYALADRASEPMGFFGAVSLDAEEQGEHQPFKPFYRMPPEEAANDPDLAARYFTAIDEWRKIDNDWLGAAGSLALKLDSDTNNTSLALAIELTPSKRVLLFPGDAQVGNWLSWEDVKFPDGARGAAAPTTRELLENTVLYKVGHHASHNATLRDKGLEVMTHKDLVAMIPVNRETAGKMDWKMPFPSLFARLRERTKQRLIDAELGLIAPEGTPNETWKRFAKKVKVEKEWIEYEVTL